MKLVTICQWILYISLVASGSFPDSEYQARLARVQTAMKQDGFKALLLTMEVHHWYFVGVATEFWASPTRPYYLVVPDEGKITAVVPSISAPLYDNKSAVGTVRVWPSPRPEDDGISELVDVLQDMFPAQLNETVRLGAELGWEFSLRMPVLDFQRLEESLNSRAKVSDATLLVKRVRAVKSQAEIAHQRLMCQRQSEALDRIPSVVYAGMTEDDACRIARIELLRSGADRVPYMSCRSGAGGYDDIVGAATQRVLREGDMLIIDTGSMRGGYYCDFNRNWYIGDAADIPRELVAVQEALYAAVDAGIEAARVGQNTADIFHAMSAKLPGPESSVGRSGHGSGLAITEWPSILPAVANQNVTLEEGMIFSLEPSLGFGEQGQFLVHEEVVVVRNYGGELLSKRGPRTIPVIAANRSWGTVAVSPFYDKLAPGTFSEAQKLIVDSRSATGVYCVFNGSAVGNGTISMDSNDTRAKVCMSKQTYDQSLSTEGHM